MFGWWKKTRSCGTTWEAAAPPRGAEDQGASFLKPEEGLLISNSQFRIKGRFLSSEYGCRKGVPHFSLPCNSERGVQLWSSLAFSGFLKKTKCYQEGKEAHKMSNSLPLPEVKVAPLHPPLWVCVCVSACMCVAYKHDIRTLSHCEIARCSLLQPMGSPVREQSAYFWPSPASWCHFPVSWCHFWSLMNATQPTIWNQLDVPALDGSISNGLAISLHTCERASRKQSLGGMQCLKKDHCFFRVKEVVILWPRPIPGSASFLAGHSISKLQSWQGKGQVPIWKRETFLPQQKTQ